MLYSVFALTHWGRNILDTILHATILNALDLIIFDIVTRP